MNVIQHDLPQPSDEPGVLRVCVAGPAFGVESLEGWLLTLSPQAVSTGRGTTQAEGGDRVLVVLAGRGKLLVNDSQQRFSAPCTLKIPVASDYQVVSQGVEPLQLLSLRVLQPRQG